MMDRVQSALKVIQHCIELLKEHMGLEVGPVLRDAEPTNRFLFDCMLHQAEVFFFFPSHVDLLPHFCIPRRNHHPSKHLSKWPGNRMYLRRVLPHRTHSLPSCKELLLDEHSAV